MATEAAGTTLVETSAGQALDGEAVGTGDTATCFHCHTELTEGEPCRVYAYRLSDESRLALGQLACRSCARDELTGTLGATEVLVDAWLAFQSMPAARQHRLVLTNTEVVDSSPPADGVDGSR